MHYITIKPYRAEGLLETETYNTDTDGVSGQIVKAEDMWRWLWQHRPCQVQVRGRNYWLRQPEARLEPMVSWL